MLSVYCPVVTAGGLYIHSAGCSSSAWRLSVHWPRLGSTLLCLLCNGNVMVNGHFDNCYMTQRVSSITNSQLSPCLETVRVYNMPGAVLHGAVPGGDCCTHSPATVHTALLSANTPLLFLQRRSYPEQLLPLTLPLTLLNTTISPRFRTFPKVAVAQSSWN